MNMLEEADIKKMLLNNNCKKNTRRRCSNKILEGRYPDRKQVEENE